MGVGSLSLVALARGLRHGAGRYQGLGQSRLRRHPGPLPASVDPGGVHCNPAWSWRGCTLLHPAGLVKIEGWQHLGQCNRTGKTARIKRYCPTKDLLLSPCLEVLSSLALGAGTMPVLASFNPFHNNTMKDTVLIALCNSSASIVAGFVVFNAVGFLALQTDSSVDSVVTSGVSLAFITYPTAILEMTPPPLWNFLFFFMLLNLALSTVSAGTQTIITGIMDEWPSAHKHRTVIILGILGRYKHTMYSMRGGVNDWTSRFAASPAPTCVACP